jgi:hypothetical protein
LPTIGRSPRRHRKRRRRSPRRRSHGNQRRRTLLTLGAKWAWSLQSLAVGGIEMRTGNLLPVLVLTTILMSMSLPLSGDHLPEGKIARGKAEHVLAGVNITSFTAEDEVGHKYLDFKTTITDIETRLGKAGQKRTKGAVWGEKSGACEYIWMKPEAWILVTTFCDADGSHDSGVYAVVVSGFSRAKAWKTERGLGLGETISDVKRIYGTRFDIQTNTKTGKKWLTIQWTDGTELNLRFDSKGRIRYLSLTASTV